MGIREYDFEDMLTSKQNNKPNELIIKHEYDMCIKIILSMFCLLLVILLIGFIVLIRVLFK